MKKLLSIVFVLFFGISLYAQTTVTGSVKDAKSGETLPGVSIKVSGKSLGTTTDFDGKFMLNLSQKAPFKLEISYVGYTTKTVDVPKNNLNLNILLSEESSRLDEVIVSASRTPESIRESPVTVERFDLRDIKNTASATFYEGLENLKGVQINTSAFGFKSINTRGFATFANERFVQLVDGMDNSAPALNFVLGNLVGMNELDVKSVELLPGASSALYGANAFNGILFMTSKSPFDYQGASVYFKTGYTSQDVAGDNEFYDMGIRFAHAFSDKFAAKATFSYGEGTEWFATDARHKDINGFVGNSNKTRLDPDYDGVNSYGELAATTLDYDAITGFPIGTFGSQRVTRTGYAEKDLTDYRAENVKTGVSFHYRPNADDLEIIYDGKLGRGNTIYQGTNRFQLKDFFLQQHKIEVRDDNFFVRGYVTSEKAGNSYDMVFTGLNLNREFKSDKQWFTDYATGYLGALTGNPGVTPILGLLGLNPGNPTDANAFARILADNRLPNGAPLNPLLPSRLLPGTPEFQTAFNKITSNPDLKTGSKFQDASSMYHVEGNYNFKNLVDFAEIQIGGSWRDYKLDSKGSIFTDANGPIFINEYAAYTQITKKLLDDRLKFTGSIRYDKNENFDGNYSPRLSLVYSAGDHKQHNFRASFQTGFRNPSTQNQYIGLDLGAIFLLGSAPDNLTKPLTFKGTTIDGNKVFGDSYSIPSAQAFGAAVKTSLAGGASLPAAIGANAGLLERVVTNPVQPEKVSAYEVGYRGTLGKVSIDLNVYYNDYRGFIASTRVLTPLTGTTTDPTLSGAVDILTGNTQAFQLATNSNADITSYGGTIGLNTKVFGNYDFGISYDYNNFNFNQASDPNFRPGFNTPKHRVKASFGNQKAFDNFGFNVSWRWFDAYLWQATFADGNVPAASVVDVQLNYTLPKWKSIFKLGASNILDNAYSTAIGPGKIGAQYYVSWSVNM